MLLLRRTRSSGRELWSRCAAFALTVSSGLSKANVVAMRSNGSVLVTLYTHTCTQKTQTQTNTFTQTNTHTYTHTHHNMIFPTHADTDDKT